MSKRIVSFFCKCSNMEKKYDVVQLLKLSPETANVFVILILDPEVVVVL